MSDDSEICLQLMQSARWHGDSEIRGSILVRVCKALNLQSSRYLHVCEEIASWIDCEDDYVRQSVVFALCGPRPVPGFEHLVPVGWSRARPASLHWIASAFESSYTRPGQITREVVLAVVAGVQTATAADDPIEVQWRVRDTMRVIRHFARVLNGAPAEDPFAHQDSKVDWRLVNDVLDRSGQS